MSNIFEIKDKNKKVVRRGYIQSGSTEIATEPGDYYYRIIDIDKDEVVSEGRIYDPLEIEEKEESFFVYAQALQSIKIYCPLWRKGYDTFIVEDKDTGKIISESILSSSEGQLGLDPGKYRGYLKRGVDELKSAYKDFSVFEESREGFNEIISLLLGRDFSLREGDVFKAIDEIEDSREKSVVDFLMAKRSLSMLSGEIEIDKNVHTKIRSKVDLSIVMHERMDGVWVYKGAVEAPPGDIVLEGEDKKRYKARVMKDKELLCEIHYLIDSDLRDDLMKEQEEKSRMKEMMMAYESMEDSDLAKRNRLSAPLFELSDAPSVEEDEEAIHIRIENWAYYKRIPGGAFLVIRPEDRLYSKTGECIVPIKEDLSLDKTKYGIVSKSCVLWIEDGKRRRISHMVSNGPEDGVKKSVIKRRARISERYSSVRLQGEQSSAREIYGSMIESEDILLSDMVMDIAKKTMNPNDLDTYNKHLQVILDAHLESYGIADHVINIPVSIERGHREMVFKKEVNPYLIELVEIPIEGDPSRAVHEVTSAKTFRLNPACYYIAWPISLDEREYLLRAGYVLVNTLKNNSLTVSSKIQVEVKA